MKNKHIPALRICLVVCTLTEFNDTVLFIRLSDHTFVLRVLRLLGSLVRLFGGGGTGVNQFHSSMLSSYISEINLFDALACFGDFQNVEYSGNRLHLSTKLLN